MKKQQTSSPSQLKTTQTILNSLYQKIKKQATNSPQSYTNKKSLYLSEIGINTNHERLSSGQNQLFQSSCVVNNTTQSPVLKKQLLLTQPHQIFTRHESFDNDQHYHSRNCCVVTNTQLTQILRKANKSNFLIQSYRQEVEYLKKLSFLQSEQIQKLRRMLRSQQDKSVKQSQTIVKQNSKLIDEKNFKQRPSISNTTKLKSGIQRGKSKMTRKLSLLKGQKPDKNIKKRHNEH